MNNIGKFLFNTTPPHVDHQLNALETIGNTFLSPLAHAGACNSIS